MPLGQGPKGRGQYGERLVGRRKIRASAGYKNRTGTGTSESDSTNKAYVFRPGIVTPRVRKHNRFKVEFDKMDVNKLVIRKQGAADSASTLDSRQRRALARLGLASAGAYVAPTLLALRSAAVSAMPTVEIGVAA